MTAEQSVVWPVIVSAAVAAPSIVGSAAVSTFQIPVQDYVLATCFSLIGIISRHCYDASKAGKFDLKALAFDIPTAPMLGILAYTTCAYFNIQDIIRAGAIVLGSFLGPDWIRTIGTGLAELLLRKLGAGRRDND